MFAILNPIGVGRLDGAMIGYTVARRLTNQACTMSTTTQSWLKRGGAFTMSTCSHLYKHANIRTYIGTTHGWPDKIAHRWLAVISYGFLWSLMILNDCYDFLSFLLISYDFEWLLWFPINSDVSFMISYDFIRFHNISYDFIWFLMIFY